MKQIVLYGVCAGLAIDLEESCARSGITILAGIKNVEGEVHLSSRVRVLRLSEVTAVERSCEIVIPIFAPVQRQAARKDAIENGFTRAGTIIDSTAVVGASVAVGAGVYINAGCTLGGAVSLGDFVILNRSASVGHDTHIADFASVGPGAVIAGRVKIARAAFIGAGAVVLPELEIGEGAAVGAGSVVTRSVPAGATVIGNPARIIEPRAPDRYSI